VEEKGKKQTPRWWPAGDEEVRGSGPGKRRPHVGEEPFALSSGCPGVDVRNRCAPLSIWGALAEARIGSGTRESAGWPELLRFSGVGQRLPQLGKTPWRIAGQLDQPAVRSAIHDRGGSQANLRVKPAKKQRGTKGKD